MNNFVIIAVLSNEFIGNFIVGVVTLLADYYANTGILNLFILFKVFLHWLS